MAKPQNSNILSGPALAFIFFGGIAAASMMGSPIYFGAILLFIFLFAGAK
jgi:hypothetical protein